MCLQLFPLTSSSPCVRSAPNPSGRIFTLARGSSRCHQSVRDFQREPNIEMHAAETFIFKCRLCQVTVPLRCQACDVSIHCSHWVITPTHVWASRVRTESYFREIQSNVDRMIISCVNIVRFTEVCLLTQYLKRFESCIN